MCGVKPTLYTTPKTRWHMVAAASCIKVFEAQRMTIQKENEVDASSSTLEHPVRAKLEQSHHDRLA